jgi:hypothetical protein
VYQRPTQPPEMGAEEQGEELKDALLASARIAGEAKAWERGKRAGQRGIMPPGTDVGAATRARGPEWRRGGEDTCRGMRRARMHAGGPDR